MAGGDLMSIKQRLKSWEREFEAKHGRRPSDADVRAHPAIESVYRSYSNAKRRASRPTQDVPAAPAPTTETTTDSFDATMGKVLREMAVLQRQTLFQAKAPLAPASTAAQQQPSSTCAVTSSKSRQDSDDEGASGAFDAARCLAAFDSGFSLASRKIRQRPRPRTLSEAPFMRAHSPTHTSGGGFATLQLSPMRTPPKAHRHQSTSEAVHRGEYPRIVSSSESHGPKSITEANSVVPTSKLGSTSTAHAMADFEAPASNEFAETAGTGAATKQPHRRLKLDPFSLGLQNIEQTDVSSTGPGRTNFRRLNTKKGGGGFRRGARAKFTRKYKQTHHRNHVGRDACRMCGEEGHWATDCPLRGTSNMHSKFDFDNPIENDSHSIGVELRGPVVPEYRLQRLASAETNEATFPTASATPSAPLHDSGGADSPTPAPSSGLSANHTRPISPPYESQHAHPTKLTKSRNQKPNLQQPSGCQKDTSHLRAQAVGEEVLVREALVALQDVPLEPNPLPYMHPSTHSSLIDNLTTVIRCQTSTGPFPVQQACTRFLKLYVSAQRIRAKHFGYDEFRHGQEAAIARVLRQQSTLLILATGTGKSLCYQLPLLYLTDQFRCMGLVITPLLSLIQDQIAQLPKGLRGAALNSTLTPEQVSATKVAVLEGRIDVLFIAPETLITSWLQQLLLHRDAPRIAFATVDEAHCVSEWSHNFRPAYLRIAGVLQNVFGVHNILALTATATLVTQRSIQTHLGIEDSGIIRLFSVPSNLQLAASTPMDRKQRLVYLLKVHHLYSEGATIVYCSKQKETEALARTLRAEGIAAQAYHAGLPATTRQRVQRAFATSKIRVIIATIAFGMGLNIHNVRVVIHYSLPHAPEAYAQEVGRAGRDGLPAYCHVFAHPEDLETHRCHAYGDSVDLVGIKRLMEYVAGPAAISTTTVSRIRAQMRQTGATGQALATQAAKQRIFHGVLDLDEISVLLDLKETVLTTMLSNLELLSSGNIQLGSRCAASITFHVRDEAFATTDPLLRAVSAAARPQAGGRKGHEVLDAHGLMEVAAATGLKPSEIVINLHGMRAAGKIFCEEGNTGVAFSLREPLSTDQVDAWVAALADKASAFERSLLQKSEEMHAIVESAAAMEGTETATASSLANQLIRQRLEKYFEATEPSLQSSLGGKRIQDEAPLRRAIHAFLERRSPDERRLTPRVVARIAYGIGSPAFPSEDWWNSSLWAKFRPIAFEQLMSIAQQVLIDLA
ncbi:uncharacterized protein MONBRDRAFT_31140 [Monosiga brevicollis MX1]|uniref:ATP-dependent DNA helicase Q4 n=1 Tax=Monosiga brevicollis TaxID=81824 RepID=A9URZ3_MONBE|nr:uncharacterized protein MONBRDRAFT_31140 [Monosiga brevicollis MX1]EDQ91690.1 predicted protein [Monosiga brevicollis MX1]|eukprot:XP_001742976.1 hypothetical protein [Monosiga brevicollis MX1]